jgi:hypothetical protein
MKGKEKKIRRDTHASIASNSSRLRCLDKKAAALFLTRRASRLLSPVTSGGTQSLVLTGPEGAARCRFEGGAEESTLLCALVRVDVISDCKEFDRFRDDEIATPLGT